MDVSESPPGPERRPRGGIQSLHRAFDIIEFVARFDVVGATRIATELGLSVSTVNNLCRTMADRGYLIGRRGQYRLGSAFSLLASRWDPMIALPELVEPVLSTISEKTGQAAVATVLLGMNARVLAFEQGRGPVGTPPPRGDRRALDLPTGTVLVAFTRRQQWQDYADDVAGTDKGVLRGLLEELERVEQDHVCGRRSIDPRGQTAIAVPVWSAGDAVPCALGVSAPTYLVDDALRERMLSALVAGAEELSRELGAAEVPSVARDLRWRETP
ncbi:MAG TPA: helix-turn-helix domain-containing protein [Terrimesophilobacter sp.]|nr:helix-turn-helix domain-containing protein [Terrimesophilobacter sp.]